MADDYDDDDDRPRARRRPVRRDEDDEDDRPRARRRRDEDEDDDYEDDRPRRRRRYVPDDDDDESDAEKATSIVVPYKNGPALAAYYCGVFGLIPIAGFILGPIALVLGILGIVRVRNNPRVHGTGHAVAGIVLGIIDPILWVVIVWLLWDTLLGPRR